MGPMTKGSNLPYRRLCVELGARVTVSEMTVARRLKQKRRSEFALIRRAADEPCFGVQLAGTNPEEMAWAAALVESRGADFVDVNLGCPIDHFTRKGLGAALSRQPARVGRIVGAMVKAVERAPVTVKIRLGWNDKDRNYLEVARAAVDAGAQAVFVHGRTRDARYRHAAEWDAIAEVAAALPVPVIGNGDLLFGHEIAAARERAGCAGVMVARGALIKPWIFREALDGYRDVSAEERLAVLPPLCGSRARALGRRRARPLARDASSSCGTSAFWCRYAPRRARRLVSDDAGARGDARRHDTPRRPAGAHRRGRTRVARRPAARARRADREDAPPAGLGSARGYASKLRDDASVTHCGAACLQKRPSPEECLTGQLSSRERAEPRRDSGLQAQRQQNNIPQSTFPARTTLPRRRACARCEITAVQKRIPPRRTWRARDTPGRRLRFALSRDIRG